MTRIRPALHCRLVRSRSFRRSVPALFTAFGSMASLAISGAVADLALLAQLLIAAMAGGTGTLLGAWLLDRFQEAAQRELARFNLPTPLPVGAVRSPGIVVGPEFFSAAQTLADLVISESWVAIEGESGLGKSTLVRVALEQERIVKTFVDAEPRDRRVVIDFDDVDCSAHAAIRVLSHRIGGETDADAAHELRKAPTLIVLDHLEQFFRSNSRSQLDELVGWLHREAPLDARVIVIAQGLGTYTVANMLGRSMNSVHPPRLTDASAVALIGANAPSLRDLDVVESELLGTLAGAFAGLPRAVRLLATTLESEISSPFGTERPEAVLRRYERRIRAGDIEGIVAEEGDVLRNLSLQEAVRLVLGSHLVTTQLRNVIVNISTMRAGLQPHDAAKVIELPNDDSELALRAALGQALRLGLVFDARAGLAAEPAVAMHLVSAEHILPHRSTKHRWCDLALGKLRQHRDGRWATDNAVNLSDAIHGSWPGASALALSLLSVLYPDIDEDLLLRRAAGCDRVLVETAVEGVSIRPASPSQQLARALLQEVLAQVLEQSDWRRSRVLRFETASFYSVLQMHDRTYRVARALYDAAEPRKDLRAARWALEHLGKLASIHKIYDGERFASYAQAGYELFTTYLSWESADQPYDAHREAHVRYELGRLALYDRTYDSGRFASPEEAASVLFDLSLRELRSNVANCKRGMAATLLELGRLAVWRDTYPQIYRSATAAAHSYFTQSLDDDLVASGDPNRANAIFELGKLALDYGCFDETSYESAVAAAFDYFNHCARIDDDPELNLTVDQFASMPSQEEVGSPRRNSRRTEALLELGNLALAHDTFDRSSYQSASEAVLDLHRRVLSCDRPRATPQQRSACLALLGWLAIHRNAYDQSAYESAPVAALNLLTESLNVSDEGNEHWSNATASALLELGILAVDYGLYAQDRFTSVREASFVMLHRALTLYCAGTPPDPSNEAVARTYLSRVAHEVTLPEGGTAWVELP
jgi:hypothetical protein